MNNQSYLYNNPNTGIKNISDIGIRKKIKYYVFLDASGSQNVQNSPIQSFIDKIEDNDTYLSTFGHYGDSNTFNDGWTHKLTSKISFNWSTHTYLINKGLRMLPSNDPIHLVFQGDGVFDDPLNVVLDRNIDKLQNVKSLTFVFSPWTQDRIINILQNDISKVLEKVKSAIGKPNFVKLQYTNIVTSNEVTDSIIAQIKDKTNEYSFVIPHNYYTFGTIAIDKLLTPTMIANMLQKDKLEEAISLLKETIQFKPELLNVDGSIYQTLHAMTKYSHYKKEYADWVSTYYGKNQNPEIRKLIFESKTLESEEKYQLFLIDESKIGVFKYTPFMLSQYNKESIIDAIRDGSGIKLNAMIPKILNDLHFTTDNHCINFNTKTSFSCPSLSSEKDILLSCLSTMFLPFNAGIIATPIIKRIAMIGLASDIEICIELKEILKQVIDKNDIEDLIGYKINSDSTIHIDDLWYSFPNARLLYRFLLIEESRWPDSSLKNLLQIIWKIIRLNHNVLNYKNIIVERTVKKIVQPKSYLTQGCIALIDDATWCNKNDPYPSMPSIVILNRESKSSKQRKWHTSYLDSILNGSDNISVLEKHLFKISDQLSDKKLKVLNEYMISLHQYDDLIPSKTRCITLYNERMVRIRDILAIEDLEIKYYNQIIKIPIPLPTLLDILQIEECYGNVIKKEKTVLKRDEINELLLSSEKNKVISKQSTQNEVYTLKYDGQSYIVLPEEIDKIRYNFFNSLSLTDDDNDITGSTSTNIRECRSCLDYALIKDTIRINCGHIICTSCNDYMKPIYQHGDFIMPYRHQCPLRCHNSLIEHRDKWWSQSIKEQYRLNELQGNKLRFCSHTGCTTIFEAGQLLGCGAEEHNLPDKCSRHREQDEDVITCPGCSISISHAGGCAHMVCCLKGTEGCTGDDCDHGSIVAGLDTNGLPAIVQLCGAQFCRWCRANLTGSHNDNYIHTLHCDKDPRQENNYEDY
jgi:hypothetical protein